MDKKIFQLVRTGYQGNHGGTVEVGILQSGEQD